MEKLYYKASAVGWDGDSFGNEWMCGYCVLPQPPDPYFPDEPRKPFAIYEDDGAGNGDYVGECDTFEQARAAVDALVGILDDGRYPTPMEKHVALSLCTEHAREPNGSHCTRCGGSQIATASR